MKIVPIGVGGAFAKTLYQTNFYVIPDEGSPFLVDCGHTASRALADLNIQYRSISNVLLSHLHADHIGGLEELGFSGYFIWRSRPTLHVPSTMLHMLWSHSLEGGMGRSLKNAAGQTKQATIEDYFDVCIFDEGATFSMGSVAVTSFPTRHVPGCPSVGFHLEDYATGKRVMLSCDSMFSPENLERYGADADAIFHDCQMEADTNPIHALLEELMTLDEAMQEKIILVHYSDNRKAHAGKTGKMALGVQGRTYSF